MARLVAYDGQMYPLGLGPGEKIDRAGIGDRIIHARTIDIALHFRPNIFLAGLPQVVAHAQLGRRKFGWNQISLEGYLVEKRIVADDGVVKIDADAHGWCRSTATRSRQREGARVVPILFPRCSRLSDRTCGARILVTRARPCTCGRW